MTETERVERFEAAYNRIDRALGELAERKGQPRRHSFAARVRIAANRQRRLSKYVDFLLEAGELRNAIVHHRYGDDVYIAVPNEQTVLRMEEIERRMFSPQRVIPRFARQVVTLQPGQSLAEAWSRMRDDGYSMYPVYEDHRFMGLLTSNGFARWCAAQMRDGRLEIDARRVFVSDVLEADHRRHLVEFMSRDSFVEDADRLFSEQPKLEAIIVTEHGRADEPPIGMIGAADVAALEP